jgi:hypothetical protein
VRFACGSVVRACGHPLYRLAGTRTGCQPGPWPTPSPRRSRWASLVPASCNVRRADYCDAEQVLRRCLIVDDNERFLEIARLSLERQEEDLADLIASSPAAGFLSKSLLSAAAVRNLVDAGRR